MSKRKACFREMVDWARANPGKQSPVAPVSAIKDEFVCGTRRAMKVRDRALETAGEADPETAETPGLEFKKTEDGLKADVTLQTDPDEEPGIEDALENEAFKKALESGAIDLDDYVIDRFKVNRWPTTVKLKGPEGEDVRQVVNHQFSVRWKRAEPRPVVEAVERIADQLPEAELPEAPEPDIAGDMWAEVALYDTHFGKLAWAAETGENYDIDIARRVVRDAVLQMRQKLEREDVALITMPVGNDWLHANNPQGTTPENANPLDVDTRLARAVEAAGLAVRDTVEELREVAPVELLWVPGNHDPQTSYYLCRELAAWYRNDGRVDVDVSPQPRKVRRYGVNLLMWMHGDMPKSREKALPGIFADEAADLWQPDQYREIHRAHLHSKKELYFAGASGHGSVVVRRIPSLCGTDYWHYEKGYVGSTKTAQMFLYGKDYGLDSIHDVHVDPAFYRDMQSIEDELDAEPEPDRRDYGAPEEGARIGKGRAHTFFEEADS